MKALKIILVILVVIVGGYSAWMATLDSKYAVERTTVINADPETVYATVSDFTTWSEWSKWHKMDPDMKITYHGDSVGEGASYSWDGEISKKGTQTITAAVPNESLTTHIAFDGMGESDGYWKFEPTEDGQTKVTWGFTGEFPFFFRVFGRGMDEQVGGDFEEGLANLKALVEAMPAKAPAVEITMVKVEPMNYYSIAGDVQWNNIKDFLGNSYGQIMDHLGADAANMTMQPFAIYHEWNEEAKMAKMEAGIAATSQKPGTDKIKKGTTHGGSALKAIHVGGYNTEPEHMAMYKYTQDNGIEMVGSPWEVYVTDPGEEPDSTKWVTEVYYPVIDPADAGEPIEPAMEE